MFHTGATLPEIILSLTDEKEEFLATLNSFAEEKEFQEH